MRFWERQGNEARVQLHRDAAAYAREGAELERRWAELVASEGEEARADEEAGFRTVGEREAAAEQAEIANEMRESELSALRRSMRARAGKATERDEIADERERDADEREREADDRERLADEREGTSEAREVARLERLRRRELRDRAAGQRQQAELDRESARADRDDDAKD